MNFYTIRIILIFLIYIALSVLYRRITIENEKHKNKLFKRMLIICIILVFTIKPEKLFLKFNSIESAFKYSFPTKKILFTESDEDYGFAIYQNDKEKDIIYFEKNDNKWKFSIGTKYKYKYIGSTIITVKNIKNTKNYFIYVDYKNTDKKSIEVYDSMGNKYIECKVDNKYNYYYFVKDKPDNYYIMLDNKKVNID